MDNQTVALIAIVLGGMGVMFWLISKKFNQLEAKSGVDESLREWLKSMQDQIGQSNKSISDSLFQSQKAVGERLDHAAKFIGDLGEKLGEMSEIGRSIKDLEQLMKSPKLRGNLGEAALKDLLGDMFPEASVNLQYAFKSGETVDVALKTANGIIPIDAKFPMENFKKMVNLDSKRERTVAKKAFANDVRKHIRTIGDKYIRPDEGTIDYGLMYVPSETIFYELSSDERLMDYARSRRVLPVSPNTLYAYLRTVLISLEGKKFEKEAMRVMRELRAINQETRKFGEGLEVLSKHVNNAYNNMNGVMTKFFSIRERIHTVTSLGKGMDEEAKQLNS